MTRASGWAGGTGRTGFSEQLHQLWQTRPRRLPRQGPIAGVAAGFGHRYGVDPVLVRVVFVVSTIFGGAGVVLYLAAWLLLPAAGDQVSAAEGLIGRGHSSQTPTKTVVLLVALAIAVTTMGPVGVGLAGSGLISFVLMLAGWWLLFLRQPQPPADGYGPLPGEGDIAATGYPGAVFPGGSPWGPTYGPYTRLPDHYEPEQAKATGAQGVSTGVPDNTATDVLRRPEADTAVLRTDNVTEPLTSPLATGEFTEGASRDSAGEATGQTSQDSTGEPGRDSTTETEVMPGKASTTAHDTARTSATPPPFRTAPGPARPGLTPPGWDPLGVAPMAWDLPEPGPGQPVVVPPPPPQRRPRSRLTPMVIGLAILAAAAAGALAASGLDWMTPGRIGAVALAVVGLGLIFGAFLRRGYGLMVVLAPLAGFVILASMVGPVEFDRGAMGDHVWTPATVTALDPEYRINMGSGTLDLRSLALTENRTVDVSVRMGDFRALVPDTMRVQANCTSRLGDIQCPQGITGPADGPVLTLNVDVQAGDAEVKRG
ncbi:phage shock protein PspC (stress-responsive transcriptional regulator) [Nocardia transvalensis]|uniref:Phage shock protein PspC (Stress-responsive transcriptional regulator) n=1 Tax=Nocardia transvalensis TaxID=37333 RepID=A0A7W9PES9_9NOCA|nr:PspC domain-containing protein [Nocardia transvalensis]MBB5914720.1 phage shock protein PspC (stress-responsive transcriptional regulator) [Nocardia transvalensis]